MNTSKKDLGMEKTNTNSANSRNIVMTTALPYANGPLHLGHMLEHVQADIWARFQRANNHTVHFICADDAHGTPIMLKAKNEGITPEQLVERIGKLHKADFDKFNISFDNFYTTHSPENKELSARVYNANKDAGHIETREIMQAYDEHENMFLPDRFIKGECPKCRTPDQYGDNCESCGATYSPTDLINPVSVLSGKTPTEKASKHYFFKLQNFEEQLKTFLKDIDLQQEAKNKLKEWFDSGLKDWDISRDAPYFGFEIPGEKDKFFYVWLDAPIGYMASFKNYADKNGLDFEDYWKSTAENELYHFIGKDILYFHGLFWPAMLQGANMKLPNGIFAHGFLTVNGQKMSKSRGTFIMANTYVNHFETDYIRYYLAAKLNAQVEDFDLNLDDFVTRVNSDLVGKVVNIASRCSGFMHKLFDNQLADALHDEKLYNEFAEQGNVIADHFNNRRYSKAITLIAELADKANTYVNDAAPWVLAKELKENPDDEKLRELHLICTQAMNLFKVIMTYLSPVIPQTANKSGEFLNFSLSSDSTSNLWASVSTPLLNHEIQKYKHIAQRIDKKTVDKMLDESKEALKPTENAKTSKANNGSKKAAKDANENDSNIIEIGDFTKVDLRVAKIINAEHVEGADKLLRIQLDIGEEKPRQVFAGIKSAYDPEKLIGRHTLMVANLKPRKMKFGLSEGMILAASDESGSKSGLYILSPDEGAAAGMRVK